VQLNILLYEAEFVGCVDGNSVHIPCTGIAYRDVTGLWAPSLRNEEGYWSSSCSFSGAFVFSEAYSACISLNLVFRTL
jgi:hypothetical protein